MTLSHNDNNFGLGTLNMPVWKGFLLFILLSIFMLLVLSIASGLLLDTENISVRALRITQMMQDIFLLLLPPIITAILITHRPAVFLNIDRFVGLAPLLLSVAIIFVAEPAMNVLIKWNMNVTLPESMSTLEELLKQMEENATRLTNMFFASGTVGSLIISILIIGVMAGLCEELFFRGGMLKLFLLTGMSHHLAIWLVAFIFSVIHFQFYGFFPRLLLGAYFGYLVWWSRSLWLPIIVHAVNNSVVVIAQWKLAHDGEDLNAITNTMNLEPLDTTMILLAVLSFLATIFCIEILRRNQLKNR